MARGVRRLSIPAAARHAENPFPATPEILAEARAHFNGRVSTAIFALLPPVGLI